MEKSYWCIIVGEPTVGKTTFMTRLLEGDRLNEQDDKLLNVDGVKTILKLKDVQNGEAMSDLYYKNCQLCVLMYSVTDLDSITKVEKYIEEVKLVKAKESIRHPAFIIFGNKNDLQNNRQVTTEHAIELERRLNIPVIEGSCAQGPDSVLDVVQRLIRIQFKIDGVNQEQGKDKRCIII